ncbi:phage tail protein [Achromobacter xylosoxidans]|uniref:phage tail protein n=1 Tax=Alcaligenes xylosoxydans xylosoxydans TaxID=85698 RepID=UPI003EDF5507
MQLLKSINVGLAPNDQTGDTLRDAMAIANENFAKTRAGVEAVEVSAAAAQRKADAALPATEKGAAGGVTPLDAMGKVPAAYLPPPAVPLSQKSAPGGVAPLDDEGRVPADHLPAPTPSVPLAEKGQPNGVATLAANGRIPSVQLPDLIPLAEKAQPNGVATLAEDGRIVTGQLPPLIPVGDKGRPGGVATLDADGRVPAGQLPAVQDAVPLAEKGQAGGVATLGEDGKVPALQLPSIDSIPLGFVVWCPSRAFIWAGWAPLDGQTISRATYPEACAAFLAGTVPMVEDAAWLADPTKRASYAKGDGRTTLRLPDLNGKSQGTLGALFLRGDGLLSNGSPGQIQRDQLQNHEHLINLRTSPATGTDAGRADYGVGAGSQYGTVGAYNARLGAETRPLNATGCWVVKLAGVVVNAGAVDAMRVAADLAMVDAVVQALKGQLDGAFGVGQTLQGLTTQRALATDYTNATARPIVAYGSGFSEVAGASMALVVDESVVSTSTYGGPGARLGVSGIVPPGASYRIVAAGLTNSNTLTSWKEYR